MTTFPLHIVAVMGLVRRGNDVLMIESPKRGWECPGGQVEVGEDPVAALEREVTEETGCRCRVLRLAAINTNVGKRPNPVMSLDFVCEYEYGALKTSAESLAVAWMNPNEALSVVGRPAMAERLRHLLTAGSDTRVHAYRLDPYVPERLISL